MTSRHPPTHELPLAEAPGAYDQADKRVGGYTRVLLHPAARGHHAAADPAGAPPAQAGKGGAPQA